jgi:exodeoxyribonuclease VII small subunit
MAKDSLPEQAGAEQPLSFEGNLEKLEGIVQRLEEGNLPLDESLRLYEEGIGAYQECQKALCEAEVKVRKLVQTLEGELKEEPFEPPPQ